MNPDNPYAAPQTVQLALREEEPAEALPLVAREYQTFCRGMCLLFWCYSLPVLIVLGLLQALAFWPLLRELHESVALIGCLLVARVPHGGWIRWGVVSAAVLQLVAVMMLLMFQGSGFPMAGIQLWFVDKLLAGMALMAAIWGLGIELDSVSMRNCGRTAIVCMGLQLVFVSISVGSRPLFDLELRGFITFLIAIVIITMYCSGWAALFFAWRLPREITARMRRCFPSQFETQHSAVQSPLGQQAAANFLRDLVEREQGVAEISLPVEEESP